MSGSSVPTTRLDELAVGDVVAWREDRARVVAVGWDVFGLLHVELVTPDGFGHITDDPARELVLLERHPEPQLVATGYPATSWRHPDERVGA